MTRLQRDDVTFTAYTALAGWAWFLYGFGAMLPLLIDEQGISNTRGGLHLSAEAVGSLIAGLSATTIVRRFARRGALVLAAALVIAGTFLLTIGSPTAVTLAAVLVMGTGGSLTINTVNALLAQHHGMAAAAALSEANAVAAGVGLLAPLAIGACIGAGLGWRPALLVTAAVMAMMAWMVRRIPAPEASLDAGLPPRSDGRRLPAAFWPLCVVVVTCVGVEFCTTTWTAELLRREVGLADAAAAAGVSAVVAGMTASRIVLSRVALRFRPRPLLFAALGVAVIGWVMLWTATSPTAAVAGLVVTGFGIGGQFPLGLALLMHAVPGQQDQASGALSVGIAVGVGAAPFALGALADALDLHLAFLVIPVLLTVAAIVLAAAAVAGGDRAAAAR